MQEDPTIPRGLCQCGCGQKTNISARTVSSLGYIKGQPRQFAKGHSYHEPQRIECIGDVAVIVLAASSKVPYFAIIDANDLDIARRYRWQVDIRPTGARYAAAYLREERTKIYLHRLLTGAPIRSRVDHKNNDGLDCRRSNMRVCTNSQNLANTSVGTNNRSGFKGVSWSKQASRWRVTIKANGKQQHIGFFDDLVEAARAYDDKARDLFGEFACVNFPVGDERGARNSEE